MSNTDLDNTGMASEWARYLCPYDLGPLFHIRAPRGWMNDPVGLICYQGVWHVFFQHAPHSKIWAFGIEWGHVASYDLVNWIRLPSALVPSEGRLDAAGCFSGCCTVDVNGVPTILYTGVRRRMHLSSHQLPPPQYDLKLPFIECQVAAFGDKGDPLLREWKKSTTPLISFPPSNNLAGFRDPFVFQRGGAGKEWIVLVGSGVKDEGGAVLVYRSADLTHGWRYDGYLCRGDGTTGEMWECPLLFPLTPRSTRSVAASPTRMKKSTSVGAGLYGLPGYFQHRSSTNTSLKRIASMEDMKASEQKYLFCISPDAPDYPVKCWLGNYRDGKFDIENAMGPFKLDLGDVLYAPNVTRDPQGRCVLWGWMQEKNPPEYLDHAGCLTVPRILSLQDGHLYQEPAPELEKLKRQDPVCRVRDLEIYRQPTPIPGPVAGTALWLSLLITNRTSRAVVIILKSLRQDGRGGAMIVYSWKTSVLKVITESQGHRYTKGRRVTGGHIRRGHGEPLELQIFLDFSTLEIFTGDGQVLSTRVYRGPAKPQNSDAGISFVAKGGSATITRLTAHEMSGIWDQEIGGKMAHSTEELSADFVSKSQQPDTRPDVDIDQVGKFQAVSSRATVIQTDDIMPTHVEQRSVEAEVVVAKNEQSGR